MDRRRAPSASSLIVRAGEALLGVLERRQYVTWERTAPDARVLMVTNAWPHRGKPTLGIFLKRTVDSLEQDGLTCDVLFVHGYRGWYCYLLGCLVLALLPLLRHGKYELVNSHGGESALVARCFLGAPVVASYWGSDVLGPQEGSLRVRAKLLLMSRLMRAHSLLMTATTTKSTEMAAALPPRARRRNWVIPDGVDRERFAPADRDRARRHVGWPDGEVTVISVGRDVPVKRLWLARHAVSLAAEQVRGLRWRLITDVAPEEIPWCYNAAHCLIHTSASEGSPNVIKEALSCNLPVVATPAGDIPELLDGVSRGVLCSSDPAALAASIVQCVEGEARSDGRVRTADLGLEQIAARVIACYRAVGLAAASRTSA